MRGILRYDRPTPAALQRARVTRPARRRLLLMADYGCWPLWEPGADPYQLTPHDLPLSGALRARLAAWAEAFDATLNWDDPATSDFPDEAARQAFHAEGAALAELLRAELGGALDMDYRES